MKFEENTRKTSQYTKMRNKELKTESLTIKNGGEDFEYKNKKHSPSQGCQKGKEKHENDNLLEMKLPDWSRLKNGNLVDCQNFSLEMFGGDESFCSSSRQEKIPSGLRKYFDNYFIIT
ncbi:hypothetical protein Avbf_10053 [Armadillidium vulgare]|nr:hypothetical protein Avbf_10053 [Armadillidium vulgare]